MTVHTNISYYFETVVVEQIGLKLGILIKYMGLTFALVVFKIILGSFKDTSETTSTLYLLI